MEKEINIDTHTKKRTIKTSYLLVSYEYDWYVGAKVLDLRRPLLRDVLERVWGVYGEAHEDDVGVGVGERAETVVVLLTSGIPQRKLDLKSRHFSNVKWDRHVN